MIWGRHLNYGLGTNKIFDFLPITVKPDRVNTQFYLLPIQPSFHKQNIHMRSSEIYAAKKKQA